MTCGECKAWEQFTEENAGLYMLGFGNCLCKATQEAIRDNGSALPPRLLQTRKTFGCVNGNPEVRVSLTRPDCVKDGWVSKYSCNSLANPVAQSSKPSTRRRCLQGGSPPPTL